MKDLTKEFGARLVDLQGGRRGLRGQLNCEVKAAPGADELDFIATDETLDRYNEVVRLDGWEIAEYLANPVVVDSHNYWTLASLLGNTTALKIRDGAMHNRVKFARDNPLGDMAYKMASKGFIHSESVGFIPLEWKQGMTKDEPARTYTKQTLLEISLVVVPANPSATVGMALKAGAITRADVRRAAKHLEMISSEPKADDPVNSGAKALDVAQRMLVRRAQLIAIGQS